MHTIYKLFSVLKQGVQVECITAFDNNVIVGTRNGQLIMYTVDEEGSMDMLMFNKNFSKKPITQVEVAASQHLLFVLTDGLLYVCDVSRYNGNFAVLHSPAFVKGCTLFTLSIEKIQSTTGMDVTLIRVACIMKRRLHCYYWKKNHLASPNFHIELKDAPKSLYWMDNFICVGYKDEYILYNIQDKKTEKHDLIKISAGSNVDPCIDLLRNDILSVTNNDCLATVNTNVYLRDDNVKKAKFQQSVNLSTNRLIDRENRDQSMVWPSPIITFVWDEPFIIGRVTNGIEIRCLETCALNKETLLQTFTELNRIKFLVRATSGVIFAGGATEIWCLRRTDIPLQRQKLLESKLFQVAIDLTHISDESPETKTDLIKQIHIRYAKELFTLKQYSAAMREYLNANANPYDVIRLYPNLMPEAYSLPKVGHQNDDNDDDVVDENSDFSELPAKPTEPPKSEEDDKSSIEALIHFLAHARQKEVVKTLDKKTTSNELLSIIDTTLLKCYLQTNASLISPLLRLNQCHFEQSEAALLKHNKISELIILYQNNSCHQKALQLLRKEAVNKDSKLFGREKSIQYLQQLGATNLPLILEFSDWILNENPEDGLRIFIEEFIEVENLPRAKILDYLLEKHKCLVIPYLEHVIHVWKDTNTQLHNILIQQYCDKFAKEMRDDSTEQDKERSTPELNEKQQTLKSKLNKLLKTCQHYAPEVAIMYLTSSALLEERAIVLGRLGKHQDVLIIYVYILGDITRAKEYCEAAYSDNPTIFVELVKLLVCPLTHSPFKGVQLHTDFLQPKETIILDLLNTYPTKIDPMEIWQHLPKSITLKKLYNYLETVLRTQKQEQHYLEIKKSLLQSEMVRLETTINEQKNVHFEITESTVCPECRKRFTAQGAFVHYPDGELVHLSCYDKRIMADNLFGA